MANFNFLNVRETAGAGRADRQAYEINALKMDQARQQMSMEQQKFDEAQQLKNTKWLAAAAQLGMKHPEQLPGIIDEGKRKGILRQDFMMPDWMGAPEELQKSLRGIYDTAMAELSVYDGDRLTNTDIPADVRTGEWYASATPEQRSYYDRAKRTQPGLDVIEVNMPDGSTMQMLYDPQWGTVYDFDGKIMNAAPPSAPGRSGQRSPYIPGSPQYQAPPQQSQAPPESQPFALPPDAKFERPPGLGRGQTPYQEARDKAQAAADVAETLRTEKETDQANTAIATGYSLMPVMERAIASTSPWTAGKGSIIADVPFFGRGTEAKDLQADLLTIKANIGFDRLQRMRAESPTGGALGQVAIQELVALQSTLRSLDQAQSYDRLAENLQDVLVQYKRWIDAWGEAVAKEGTDDQYRRYYETVPPGAEYYHRNGMKIRKRK